MFLFIFFSLTKLFTAIVFHLWHDQMKFENILKNNPNIYSFSLLPVVSLCQHTMNVLVDYNIEP
jgi:hypothetical protein